MAPDRPSAFFFTGRLTPEELANFNVQNVPLNGGDAYAELFGHAIAIWWPSRPRADASDLVTEAARWVRTIAASYYLVSGVPLDVALLAWVEALDVHVNEAVIGVIDNRFHRVRVVEADDATNEAVRRAVNLAQDLRGAAGERERAADEVWRAACDGSDEAFLSAFRALECVRRLYEPTYDRRKAGWSAMATAHAAAADDALHEQLSAAAECVRHGDRPASRAEAHTVNVARSARQELINYATTIVRRETLDHFQPTAE